MEQVVQPTIHKLDSFSLKIMKEEDFAMKKKEIKKGLL
ncbi:hypothetical protein H477_4950 [[Clostridium] sordellii ATCC 9714]|nr:hypothetical protein H477_4950 [[Clostridium] sordellii ATCC 9714] [Paeniclostridium sordellii ATCC 9714]